jgi:hypothetical protein
MGLVNPELLLQNEYLAAENRILRAPSRLVCGFRILRGETAENPGRYLRFSAAQLTGGRLLRYRSS